MGTSQICLDNPLPRIREAGLRQTINFPIQSGAQGVLKLATTRLWDTQFDPDYLFVLQVHDEIIGECSEEKLPLFIPWVKNAMENTVKLSVPLLSDVEVGTRWGSLKEI
jgi:DNA polymerase I